MASDACVHCKHTADEHGGFLCQAEPTEGERYAEEWGCTCPGLQLGSLTRQKRG